MISTTTGEYSDYVVFVESKSLRVRSKAEYLRQVRKLAEHYAGRELGAITEREVFDYLIHRREAVVALRMFYRDYLGRQWRCGSAFKSDAISRCRSCSLVRKPGGCLAA